MLLTIESPWDPTTVIKLLKLNVVTDAECRRLLDEYRTFHGMPPLGGQVPMVLVSEVNLVSA